MLKKRRRLVEMAKRCILWRFEGGVQPTVSENACEGSRTWEFFEMGSGAEEEGSKLGRLANSLRLVPRYKQSASKVKNVL